MAQLDGFTERGALCVWKSLRGWTCGVFPQGPVEAKLLCLGELMCLQVYLSIRVSKASNSLTLARPDEDNALGMRSSTPRCKRDKSSHKSSSTVTHSPRLPVALTVTATCCQIPRASDTVERRKDKVWWIHRLS